MSFLAELLSIQDIIEEIEYYERVVYVTRKAVDLTNHQKSWIFFLLANSKVAILTLIINV